MRINIKPITTVNEVDRDIDNDDYVTKCMGSFGLWQAMYCTIAACTRLIAMWNLLSMIFLTPATEFECKLFKNNVTFEVNKSTCYEDCVEYEYHQDVFDSTLISKFNLICEDAWLASFTQTVLMLGVLFGASLYGWISDRFGRRNAFRLSTFLNIVFMLIASYAPNYWVFTGVRFFIGIASGAILNVSAVYIIELVGSDHKEIASCCTVIPDGLAEASLSIFAYFSTTWDKYLFEYWIVSGVIFLFVVTLPETPRWLVSKGRIEKAVELVTSAAERNKRSTDNIREIITKSVGDMIIKNAEEDDKKYNYIDLFRNKEIALKTVCMFITFFAAGGGYFGITQHVTFLGSNIYLDVALLGLIQVPVLFLPMFLYKFCGRKSSIITTFVITGTCMAILIFIPKGHWTFTLFGVIGMSSISASFAVQSLFLSELFPTPVRNMAFGITLVGTQIGSMITPFIATLTPAWIPSLVLAVIPFAASFACALLPETKGLNLKDSVN